MTNKQNEFGAVAGGDDLFGPLKHRPMWSQKNTDDHNNSGYFAGASSLHSFIADIMSTDELSLNRVRSAHKEVYDADAAKYYLDLIVGVKGMHPFLKPEIADKAKEVSTQILIAIKSKHPGIYPEYAEKLKDADLQIPPALLENNGQS